MPRRRPTTQNEPTIQAALDAVTVYSRNEVNAQLGFVEDMIIQGASTSQIVRLAKARFNCTALRVRKLIDRVKDVHAKEDAESRAEWKSAQIRRLHTMRRFASGERTADGTGWITKPDHKAVYAYESLLAKICGTLEPVTLDVNVRYTEAMLAVVANLTDEQATAMLEEAKEQERLANAARRLLPAHVVTDSIESVDAAE